MPNATLNVSIVNVVSCLVLGLIPASGAQVRSQNHRLVILTDMGNEPDDSQTMVHLLMYSNEVDIEGLIAVTSRWLNPSRKPPANRIYPELIVERVKAYGSVRDNLLKHASGWPTEEYLLSRVAAGQPGYGMDSVGDGKGSGGSRLIMEILEKDDPRPVYFAINAGSNTLAQALWDLRQTRSEEQMHAIIDKIRVYDDAGQDNAGAWICNQFGQLTWARNRQQVFSLYCGGKDREAQVKGPYTWQPYSKDAQGQHDWADEHIKKDHGPLGALYPDRFGRKGGLEGGGTTSWIGLVNKGLCDPEHITWGGWSGRFTAEKQLNVPAKYQSFLEENYKPFFMFTETTDQFTGEGLTGFSEWVDEYRNPLYNPIWKWRRAYMNDFAGRMDWCVKDYEYANHNPIAAFNGNTDNTIICLKAKPGQEISLDASASRDPDGGTPPGGNPDTLNYRWFVYPDVTTYKGPLRIGDDRSSKTSITIPKDAAGCQIHIILQVDDNSPIVSVPAKRGPSMCDYRRIVIDVERAKKDKALTLPTDDEWWLRPHRMIQTNLREIDAMMDLDRYVRDVKDFGADVVLFNIGGIVANYPTDLEFHWRNTYMKGDMAGTVLEKLHAEGIRMIGRFDFSKINEKFASQNPQWLYVGESGQNVNYNGQVHTCVSGGYQQQYMFKILGEAVDRYPLDGVFFNMIGYQRRDYSGNYHGICQCQNCKRLFKQYSGLELPTTAEEENPTYKKYLQFTSKMKDRQFSRVNTFLKSKRASLGICTYTKEGIDIIRKESNSALGKGTYIDTDRAKKTLLEAGRRQLANAAVHFIAIGFRHASVAPYLTGRRLFQQMINGAWLDFYCIGPLHRQEDRPGLTIVRDIYRFGAANEEYLLETKPAAQVALFAREDPEYTGMVEILCENQIPFELVDLDLPQLREYEIVIIPGADGLKDQQINVLDKYIEQGGKALITGRIPAKLQCLNSLKFKNTRAPEKGSYIRIRPEDRDRLDRDILKQLDLVFLQGIFHVYESDEEGPRLAGIQTDNLLRLIPGDMFGPPEKCYYRNVSDVPALFHRQYGKGSAAYFPWEIASHYHIQCHQGHANLVLGVMENLLGLNRNLKVQSHRLVEVTHRQDNNNQFEWVALYNHSGQREDAIHPPIPMNDIEIYLRPAKPVKTVRLLKDTQQLGFSAASNGQVSVTVPQLKHYEIVLFEYR